MRTGRPRAELVLTQEEREELERLERRRKSAQDLAMRARIVLACSAGTSNKAVAQQLGVTARTVGKWRKRYVERRVEGLTDEPRPGTPRTLGDDQIEEVVTRTLESIPKNATHWSTRSMA